MTRDAHERDRDAPRDAETKRETVDPERTTRRAGDAITRRRFVGLIAAGAGATLATPALAAVRPKTRRGATPVTAPIPPRVAKGLAEQRESLAKTLATIRGFDLPTGSEQGFAFRPLPPERNS